MRMSSYRLVHSSEGPLAGRVRIWYGDAGLRPGNDSLIITRQVLRPDMVTTLHKTCKKLTARMQQQIEELIRAIVKLQKRPHRSLNDVIEWRSF